MPELSDNQEMEFVGLLTEHQPLIRAYVISLLPGSPDTDDVTQETNQVLWRKRGDFELGTSFKAWAMAIARFQVMAFQQKLKREKRAPLDDDVFMMISEEAELRDSGEMKRQLKDLNECIGMLQMKDQELILHRYWKKSGLIEYSKATGRSVGSLKVALHRLRGSLRNCLNRKREMGRSLI